MKKTLALILALVMTLSLLAGCGGSDQQDANEGTNTPAQTEDGSTNTESKTLKMGFVFNSLDNPIYVNWRQVLEEYCPKYNFELTYLVSDEDVAKELSNVEDLLEAGCDVIGLRPADTEASKAVIELCNKAGVPVFILDAIMDDVNVITQHATDNYVAAGIAAQQVIDLLGEKGGKVCILRGIYGLSLEADRYNGFVDALADYSNIKIEATAFGNFHREDGYTAAEDVLQACPDVDVIYCENGEMAVACVNAVKAAGKDGVVVIGYDGSPDELALIKDGSLYGCVFQVFNTMVPEMIKEVRDYMDGKDVPCAVEWSGGFCTLDNYDKYYYEIKN